MLLKFIQQFDPAIAAVQCAIVADRSVAKFIGFVQQDGINGRLLENATMIGIHVSE